jgi:hypothetical protein
LFLTFLWNFNLFSISSFNLNSLYFVFFILIFVLLIVFWVLLLN